MAGNKNSGRKPIKPLKGLSQDSVNNRSQDPPEPQEALATAHRKNPTGFQKTAIQRQAIDLLTSPANNIMLYGGSRSGKTFILVYAILVRACKTESRHISFRLRFNHAKTSIWLETLPKVLTLCFPELKVTWDKTNHFITLPNGSEYWIGGLDDKDRTEKILGKEYSTLHFNECSQIPFEAIQLAKSRLAQRTDLVKKIYYDENPPRKSHWSYWQFIKKQDPETGNPLKNPELFDSMLMNPTDNIENIDPDYITNVLEQLPEKERARFLLGQFQDDNAGLIYYAFNRELHVKKTSIMPNHSILVGMDFNVDPMTAVICQMINNNLFVIDEIFLRRSNTLELAKLLKAKYGECIVIPDATGLAIKSSSAGKSDHSILKEYGHKVPPGIRNPFRMDRYNAVNNAFEKGKITVDPKCKYLIKDLEQLSYKEGTNQPDTKDPLMEHISTALGYLVHKEMPIVSRAIGVRRY